MHHEKVKLILISLRYFVDIIVGSPSMVLNAVTILGKRRKRNMREAGTKDTLLQSQKVKKVKRSIRAGAALRRNFSFSFPRIRLSLSRKTFIIAGAAATAVLILIGSFFPRRGELPAEGLSLPGESSAVTANMLYYVAPEAEAKGSGEMGIPDGRIIDTVKTFDYTIRKGETLSEIAAKHDLDVGTLISFNNIDDVRRVMAGTTLTIPDVDGIPYTVRTGDSLEKIAVRYSIPFENLLDANDLQSEIIQPGQTLFIPGGEINEYDYKRAMGTLFFYPTNGRITSGYGYRNDPFTGIRRMHYGIDLANAIGTSIVSTMEGTVAAVGNQPRGYGKYVVIKHRYGFQSLYGHLSTIYVNRGERVAQGQKIGSMGNSGRSTGSHLHFSLYKNNVPVNPLNGYLYR